MSTEQIPTHALGVDPVTTRRQLREARDAARPSLLRIAREAVVRWIQPTPEYVGRVEGILENNPAALKPGGVLHTDIGNTDYALYAQAAIGRQREDPKQ